MRQMECMRLRRAEKAGREGETERRKAERQESREVGGCGVPLSPQMNQKHICRCSRSHRAPAESRSRVIHREQIMDMVGEGEGGKNWDSSTDIYTLPHVKQIANGKLLYFTESPARCSVTTRGMGWEVQPLVDSCCWKAKPTQHCKAVILRLKINSF